MKRIIALLLTAILMICAVPITANAAKEVSVEQKFKLLLDDIESQPGFYPFEQDMYYYKELAQFPEEDPDWILFQGGLYPDYFVLHDTACATLGNKLISLRTICSPFKLSYGVYDTESGAFYDLLDAWDMDFDALRDAWDALPPTMPYDQSKDIDSINEVRTYLIGDADYDGEVSILDATRIQRALAELDSIDDANTAPLTNPQRLHGTSICNIADFDRDGENTILDATKIQRNLAELPNVIDSKLAWDERYTPENDDKTHKDIFLINSLKGLDLSDSRLVKDMNDADFDAEKKIRDAYDDSFFEEKSLLVLDISLSSGSYYLTLKNLSIDKDGVLNVDFTHNSPQAVSDDINDRFVCIEVSKAFLDNVRDIKVNITPIREKSYDYYLMWDEQDINYIGNTVSAERITEYDQLSPSNSYHKKLLTELSDGMLYPQDCFRSNAYLLIHLPIGSTSYTVDRVYLSIDSEDILNVDVIAKGPQFGNAVVNNRFLCVEMSKDWINDSKNYKVNLEFELDGHDEDTDYTFRAAKHPYLYVADPADKAAEATLITDRSQLVPDLEGHQTLLDDYDDSFFRHHSILAIHYELPSGSYTVQFSHVDTSNNTLYVYMTECVPSIGTTDIKPVNLCIEIPSYYRYQSRNGVEVIHRQIGPYSEPIAAAANLYNAETIPHNYGVNGYRTVPFLEGYSGNLQNDNAFSPMLESYRESGLTAEGAGVITIIDDPYQMLNFVMDNKLDTGYVDGYGINYEPCRAYDYDLNFFKEASLVAIAHHGSDYLDTLTINELYQKDGTLYIDAELVEPEINAPAEADYICFVPVAKSFLKSITDIKLGKLEAEENPEELKTVIAEITREDTRETLSKVILSASSYSNFNTAVMTVDGPSPYYFHWEDTPLDDSTEGYVMLLRSRSEFEKYLPGFTAPSDSFFRENAVIAMLGQGYENSAQANISNHAVVNGNTLYMDAYVSYQIRYIDGIPALEPTAPICRKFLQVKQSDVAGITEIRFWRSTAD